MFIHPHTNHHTPIHSHIKWHRINHRLQINFFMLFSIDYFFLPIYIFLYMNSLKARVFLFRSLKCSYIIPSIYLSWYAVYLQAWWKIQEIKRFLINLNLSRLNWWIQGACTILLFYLITPLLFSVSLSPTFTISNWLKKY